MGLHVRKLVYKREMGVMGAVGSPRDPDPQDYDDGGVAVSR